METKARKVLFCFEILFESFGKCKVPDFILKYVVSFG